MPTLVEPILGRAFRKARQAMRGDASKRLAEAMPKISQLRKRLAEIAGEQSHHAKRFVRYVAECREKFERTKTFQDEVALLQAEIAKDWHERHATDPAIRAKLLQGIQTLPTAESEAFSILSSTIADWREPLETASKAKTQISEQALIETENKVREWLSGFDAEDIENDPRLKEAKREAARWEGLQQHFANQKDLQAWTTAIHALFPNEK